jgi:DNA-binding transcriptional regulator/RsmH inhibitor MraZ
VSSLPTQRLSPKNQVTLPREARAFFGVGEEGQLCGMQHRIVHDQTKTYPILFLMTEKELQRKEQRILDDKSLSPQKQFEYITKLNGGVRRMAIDAQHRIVLPAHFVAHLGIDRDIFFVSTNSSVQVWNPAHYLRWSGQDRDDYFDPNLDAYLTI